MCIFLYFYSAFLIRHTLVSCAVHLNCFNCQLSGSLCVPLPPPLHLLHFYLDISRGLQGLAKQILGSISHITHTQRKQLICKMLHMLWHFNEHFKEPREPSLPVSLLSPLSWLLLSSQELPASV